MAILDSELQTEITTDPLGKGYAGCGARPLAQKMNEAGSASVETWMPAPDSRPVSKEDFLQLLSLTEAAALQDLMDGGSPTGQALKFKLSQSTSIDMSKAPNREFMTALEAGSIVSAETRDGMLRLGEVRQSRSMELWGEHVTIEQIRGVL